MGEQQVHVVHHYERGGCCAGRLLGLAFGAFIILCVIFSIASACSQH